MIKLWFIFLSQTTWLPNSVLCMASARHNLLNFEPQLIKIVLGQDKKWGTNFILLIAKITFATQICRCINSSQTAHFIDNFLWDFSSSKFRRRKVLKLAYAMSQCPFPLSRSHLSSFLLGCVCLAGDSLSLWKLYKGARVLLYREWEFIL